MKERTLGTAWTLKLLLTYPLVPHDRGRGDVSPEDPEAGDGGEARLQERATGERDQGAGLQDIHR